jgi:hypothetical protein
MAVLTRVEVLDGEGFLAGFFFTRLPVAECQRRMIPLDFRDVQGEWVRSGLSDWRADGENAWYRSPGAALGRMDEVCDGNRD